MRVLGLTTILLCLASSADASAWMKPKGRGQSIVSTSYYRTDTYVNTHARKTTIPVLSKSEVNPYFEYGVSDELTVGANIFLDTVTQNNFTNYALADTELFFRKPLYTGDSIKIAYQPLIKLPTISSSDMPEVGSKDFDFQMGLLLGYNFGSDKQYFADINTAYRMRTGSQHNQYLINNTIGYNYGKFMLTASSFSTIADDVPNSASSNISASADYALSKAQIAAAYKISDKSTVQLGAYKDIYARNTGEGSGLLVSIWRNF